jgi:transposase InsO family protein
VPADRGGAEPDGAFGGAGTTQLVQVHGEPAALRSDNGPEFVAKAVQAWLEAAGARTLYVQPGSPWENGYVESFNSPSSTRPILDRARAKQPQHCILTIDDTQSQVRLADAVTTRSRQPLRALSDLKEPWPGGAPAGLTPAESHSPTGLPGAAPDSDRSTWKRRPTP